MKSAMRVVLSAVVSIIGLVSCSKDKAEQDTWRLSEPVIESPGVPAAPVSSANLRKFPVESELVFNEGDLADNSVSVHSECKSRIGLSSAKSSYKSKARLQLRSLWPIDMWLKLSNQDLRNSSCNFNVSVTKPNGSSHSFTMTGIQLSDFIDPAASNVPRNIDAESISVLEAALDYEHASETYLVCETFMNSRSAAALQTLANDRYHQLFFGPLSTSVIVEGAKIESSDAKDPRVAKNAQTCRLIQTTSVGQAAPTSITLTKEFEVLFPPPILVSKLSWPLREITPFDFGSRPAVFSLELRNDGFASTAIAIDDSEKTIEFQLLIKDQNNKLVLAPKKNSAKLQSVVSGDIGRSWRQNGKLIVELKTGASVRIDAGMQTDCFTLGFRGEHASTGSWKNPLNYADQAFFFRLNSDLSIEQIQDWNSETPNLKSKGHTILPTELLSLSEPTLKTFVPLSAYLQTFDPTGAAPQGDLQTLTGSYDGMKMLQCHYE